VKAERALELARLALVFHVTPAQLRACTVRELRAMERVAKERNRAMKRKGGG
jgi:hypothetical protein